MITKPVILTRTKILAFGLALYTAGLFTPIYQIAETVWGKDGAAQIFDWLLYSKDAQEKIESNPQPPINNDQIDTAPQQSVDAIDITRITQANKNRVDYNKMTAVNILRFADVDDKVHVRFNNDAPASWWASSTDHMKFVRLQTFWPDGSGYYGGHIDWVRPGQSYKTLNNIGKNYLGKQPPRGSPMYFMLVSNDGKWRSNIVKSKRNW